MSDIDRILKRIEKSPDGCWLWTSARNEDGYARLGTIRAHRLAYEILVGPIPEGLVLDHLCRVRHCVNPEHLEPVTPRENTLRGLARAAANAVKTHCDNGHEFTPENTYTRACGHRQCRTCNRAEAARYRARRAASERVA